MTLADRTLEVLTTTDRPLRAYEIAERLGVQGILVAEACNELAVAGLAFESLGVFGGWRAA